MPGRVRGGENGGMSADCECGQCERSPGMCMSESLDKDRIKPVPHQD